MKDTIYITGHKNPDTDSICSAIAYAEFKNKTSNADAIPVKLGELNKETKFVLDYFGVESPKLIETVRTQVCDLNIDKAIPISPEISLKMAWSMMKKHKTKTLPIIDENNKLLGISSVSNLTSSYMDVWDNRILAKSNTKIENIVDTLSAKYLYLNEKETIFKGKIMVAAMEPNQIKELIEPHDIVICGNREDSQKTVIESGASLLIISGNNKVTKNVLDLAEKYNCSVIVTPFDTFTASRLIIQSIPINYVMTKDNIICFSTEDFVHEIKDIMLETRYRSYPVIDKKGSIVGSISRYHLISQNKKKVILVDHNESSQSVDGLSDAIVLEVIDHHRLAAIQTGNPIYFRNEPVGSTATIVASIFFENGIRPSRKTAGILCAAIISDTVLLKSPTATSLDEFMLRRLSQIANIDINKFANEMFKQSTSLQGETPEKLYNRDFKSFNIDGFKLGVSQVSTMYIESFDPIKKDMLEFMNEKKKNENYDLLLLLVTDILEGGSNLLMVGEEKEIVEKAFDITLNKDNSIYLPNVLSRKKQVIPPLTSAISQRKK